MLHYRWVCNSASFYTQNLDTQTRWWTVNIEHCIVNMEWIQTLPIFLFKALTVQPHRCFHILTWPLLKVWSHDITGHWICIHFLFRWDVPLHCTGFTSSEFTFVQLLPGRSACSVETLPHCYYSCLFQHHFKWWNRLQTVTFLSYTVYSQYLYVTLITNVTSHLFSEMYLYDSH